jgi:hypothetical protein
MPVVVLLSSEVHDDFSRGGRLFDEGIGRVLREQGVALRRMHPGSADAKLSRYYMADVSDKDTADWLISLLRKLSGIEAVYWKPADEAP